ncbi:MAG: DUF4145 domain-containing protein [Lachnospiraceae bacterium]|nr:DUF4145 domain-containing protein [Lachnospiraceae bacterium]
MEYQVQKDKIEQAYQDYMIFMEQHRNDYAAVAVRTIVEIVVNSYADYFLPMGYKGPEVTIMEKITALEKCEAFRGDQISSLHLLRKIGNAGAHQGKEFELTDLSIKNAQAVIEDVIAIWKSWIEDQQKATQSWKSKESTLNRGYIDTSITPLKKVVSLIALLFFLSMIVYATKDKMIEMLSNPRHYDTTRIWVRYLCYAGFLLIAVKVRRYGIVQRIVCDLGVVYFLIPRIYLALYSIVNGYIVSFFAYLLLTAAIFFLYLFVCIAVKETNKSEGLKGYQY